MDHLMPKGHKPDCKCPPCSNRRRAEEARVAAEIEAGVKRKGKHHAGNERPARDDQAPRKTRQQTNPTPKSKKRLKAGPGRPKGSAIDPDTKLTPNQMRIAEKMLEAELESGLFPASVAEVARVSGTKPDYVRALLKRKEFQDYVFKLLELEGVVLEGAFWRGLALGLQVGDSRVLELYAKMTGKITNRSETKIEVQIKGAGEVGPALDWSDSEVIDVKAIEEEESGY